MVAPLKASPPPTNNAIAMRGKRMEYRMALSWPVAGANTRDSGISNGPTLNATNAAVAAASKSAAVITACRNRLDELVSAKSNKPFACYFNKRHWQVSWLTALASATLAASRAPSRFLRNSGLSRGTSPFTVASPRRIFTAFPRWLFTAPMLQIQFYSSDAVCQTVALDFRAECVIMVHA